MVLCTGLLVACDKEQDEYEPIKPPVEEPENPEKLPSTNDIIKTKIGDINMIVGTQDWKAIVNGNGKYVAVGYGGCIVTSSDGVSWTTPIQIGNLDWYDIAYGNGKFVVVGNSGYITTSVNGITWTTPTKILSTHFSHITYSGGRFVAIGQDGYILSSTDGLYWTTQQMKGYNWCAIEYNGEYFMIVGDNDSKMCTSTSTDGTRWSGVLQTNISYRSYKICGIAYGNGKFVIADRDGNICEYDGNWQQYRVDLYGNGFTNIIYECGNFILIGYNGFIYKSTQAGDYKNWIRVRLTDKTLWDICPVS